MTETNPFSNISPDNAINVLKDLEKINDTNVADTTLAPLDDTNVVSEVANVEVDLISGTRRVVDNTTNENEELISDTFEELISGTPESDILDKPLSDEAIETAIDTNLQGLKLNPSDMIEFGNLINDYKKDDTIKVFDRLPDAIKGEINKALISNGTVLSSNRTTSHRESLAKDLLDDVILDAGTEDIMIDFNTEVRKMTEEFNTDIKDLGIDQTKEQISKFREIAEKIKEKDPSKSEQLNTIADTIEDACSFKSLYQAALDNKIKVRKYDIEKPKNAFLSFNRKYEKTSWGIYPVDTIPNILRKFFTEEEASDDKLIWFTLFFVNYCNNKTPDNVIDHVFMYNTINSIVWLNFVKKDDEYAIKVCNDIKKILDLRY